MFVVNIFIFTAGQRYPLTGSAALCILFLVALPCSEKKKNKYQQNK
jgi:hypothetical protein